MESSAIYKVFVTAVPYNDARCDVFPLLGHRLDLRQIDNTSSDAINSITTGAMQIHTHQANVMTYTTRTLQYSFARSLTLPNISMPTSLLCNCLILISTVSLAWNVHVEPFRYHTFAQMFVQAWHSERIYACLLFCYILFFGRVLGTKPECGVR